MNARYDIRHGDSTTADGRVIATSPGDTLDGVAVAYEGDAVWCPKCRTTGKIVCVGERLPDRGPGGRQSALGGDWCLCKCRPCPLLIPSQCRCGTGVWAVC
ncbi:PAAR domain-containing protein [Paraburkholderia lacunae]|uniref:PAAR domain-containing protein n=1 Tax=Paraburkholderia lacunae TaxID=2211104 RepID=A0A370NC77_9BURK|nr:PAAR domain-containing protein [Paraburkholderia lacunae]RDK03186.1 PAAR domain-containing protein [Paraburkholderia lacunae]